MQLGLLAPGHGNLWLHILCSEDISPSCRKITARKQTTFAGQLNTFSPFPTPVFIFCRKYRVTLPRSKLSQCIHSTLAMTSNKCHHLLQEPNELAREQGSPLTLLGLCKLLSIPVTALPQFDGLPTHHGLLPWLLHVLRSDTDMTLMLYLHFLVSILSGSTKQKYAQPDF